MYDVFLSYSRADGQIADHIYEELTDYGLNVFFDRFSIGSGSFPERIAQGIKESKVILFLASRNSVAANYAPDELVFAKNNKPRNSIIVYRIDSSVFPDDIELLLSSLNHRNIENDPIKVVLDDILQILAQGSISRTPRVTKSIDIDSLFENLLNAFNNLDFYSVVHYEMETKKWVNNWNHHLLLMKTYKFVGDRRNYGVLLSMYQSSGIVYYPIFYSAISQVWDMIEFGFVKEAETHIKGLLQNNHAVSDKICSEVNYTHILLLSGFHQEALNRYKDILKSLNAVERYSFLLKDFDTINWFGYNQLSSDLILQICSNIGYKQRMFVTSAEGHMECEGYDRTLCSHRWHWRDGRLHIILSFRSFNSTGNSIYSLVEYERNFLGRVFNVLPFGIGESNTIQNTGKIFCQYRIAKRGGRLFLEEYNPMTEDISCGEILRLNDKELHIKILYNGNQQMAGKLRKFNAVNN